MEGNCRVEVISEWVELQMKIGSSFYFQKHWVAFLFFSGVAAVKDRGLDRKSEEFCHNCFLGLVSKVSMEVKDELMDIVEKVWDKLQALPQASPLELGAFSVLILFFGE